MVRPRFAKLAPEQQQRILQAAIDEFSAHGFHDASLNQVIEAAGISKGSLYYYFDGKDDLIAANAAEVNLSLPSRVDVKLAKRFAVPAEQISIYTELAA